MSVPNFTQSLTSSQSKSKYVPVVQTASEKVNTEAFNAAIEVVLGGADDASAADADQAGALKAAFEFATELVKMLVKEPGTEDKLKLYGYFKRARNEEPAKPGMFALEAKAKYGAWEKVKDISEQKAQALYIKQVDTLIGSIGTQ